MTSRPIWPDELLELADLLAGRGAGRGRPRTIQLLSVAFDAVATDLLRVADSFLTLQAERHLADYDHQCDVTRDAALVKVDEARAAVDRLRALAMQGDQSFLLFTRLAVGGVKVAKRR